MCEKIRKGGREGGRERRRVYDLWTERRRDTELLLTITIIDIDKDNRHSTVTNFLDFQRHLNAIKVPSIIYIK